MDNKSTCLSMNNIYKSFGDVDVLRDVTLEVERGQVLALLGENGAGKSTLMKILSGVHGYGSYEGDVTIGGRKLCVKNPWDAEKAGIAMIYQELSPFLDLTVAENIFMGQFPQKTFGRIDDKALYGEASRLLMQMKADIDARSRLRELNASQQQLVAITRALRMNASIMIFDEPTSSLTVTEAGTLFRIIQGLKSRGVGIIYISHKFDEIYQISDRIAVLRDGRNAGFFETAQAKMEDIIQQMIGRNLGEMYPHNTAPKGAVRLRVAHMTLYQRYAPEKKLIDNIGFEVKSGEILGLAGLVGCGRTEILNSIFGSYQGEAEFDMEIDGVPFPGPSPHKSKKAGLALLTEDRRANGIVGIMGVRQNLTLPALGKLSRWGVLGKKKEIRAAETYINEIRIKCTGPEMQVKNLSGGNQQKVVLSKWLYTSPRILLLDEPTRGIDVGSKVEIYEIMNRLTQQGIAIILVSSELPELLAISDRVLVLYDGKIRGEFKHGETEQEHIMALATGAVS